MILVNYKIWKGVVACLVLGIAAAVADEKGVFLVKDGAAVSVLVMPEGASPVIREAARDFVDTVRKSTGAEIQIVTPDVAKKQSAETARLVIAFPQGSDPVLPAETYRLVSGTGEVRIIAENALVDPARRKVASLPARWALNRILEDGLGVRWLWPGELGTYVPRRESLFVPEQTVEYQPRLLQRNLRLGLVSSKMKEPSREMSEMIHEAVEWAEAHEGGRRGDIRFGHAFGKWWERFSETHPDYFMQTPEGGKLEQIRPQYIKIRLGNPAVIEQIAEDYQSAGAPGYWNVCPNDGSGFDLSPETRAWDLPTDLAPDDIWHGRADLTPRYIEFWNRLGKRLREINPKVTICTYGYSSYRYPPPPERPLTTAAVVALVPRYHEKELWLGWAKTGASLWLRPNWWHFGANAPYIPLDEASDYLKMALDNGMIGADMDSIAGYWGTQGVHYYLVARMLTRPKLSKEDILKEYTEAFGKGAPLIRDYIAYWQKLTTEYRYTDPDGRYQALLAEGKVDRNLSRSARYMLPILYTDEIVAPAEAFLNRALAEIPESDVESRARVEFLRAGLTEMKATRDLVATSRAIGKSASPELKAQFRSQSKALQRLRQSLNRSHAIWNDAVTQSEDRRLVYFEPRFREKAEDETDEM